MTLTLLKPADPAVALTANRIASKIANPDYNQTSKALYALVFNAAVEELNAAGGPTSEMSDEDVVRTIYPQAYAKMGTMTGHWYVFATPGDEAIDDHLNELFCERRSQAFASARKNIEKRAAARGGAR